MPWHHHYYIREWSCARWWLILPSFMNRLCKVSPSPVFLRVLVFLSLSSSCYPVFHLTGFPPFDPLSPSLVFLPKRVTLPTIYFVLLLPIISWLYISSFALSSLVILQSNSPFLYHSWISYSWELTHTTRETFHWLIDESHDRLFPSSLILRSPF